MKCSTEQLQLSLSRPPGCRPYGPEGQDSARVRRRTDQPLAEPRAQRVLTADLRRFTQILVFMPFGHVSAILAEKLSVSICVHPRLIAPNALRYALSAFPLASFVALRLAPWNILSTEALSFHSRHYFTGQAPWNTDSIEVDSFARSVIPQGESSFIRSPNVNSGGKFQISLVSVACVSS